MAAFLTISCNNNLAVFYPNLIFCHSIIKLWLKILASLPKDKKNTVAVTEYM